jgi:hypothetical protein
MSKNNRVQQNYIESDSYKIFFPNCQSSGPGSSQTCSRCKIRTGVRGDTSYSCPRCGHAPTRGLRRCLATQIRATSSGQASEHVHRPPATCAVALLGFRIWSWSYAPAALCSAHALWPAPVSCLSVHAHALFCSYAAAALFCSGLRVIQSLDACRLMGRESDKRVSSRKNSVMLSSSDMTELACTLMTCNKWRAWLILLMYFAAHLITRIHTPYEPNHTSIRSCPAAMSSRSRGTYLSGIKPMHL